MSDARNLARGAVLRRGAPAPVRRECSIAARSRAAPRRPRGRATDRRASVLRSSRSHIGATPARHAPQGRARRSARRRAERVPQRNALPPRVGRPAAPCHVGMRLAHRSPSQCPNPRLLPPPCALRTLRDGYSPSPRPAQPATAHRRATHPPPHQDRGSSRHGTYPPRRHEQGETTRCFGQVLYSLVQEHATCHGTPEALTASPLTTYVCLPGETARRETSPLLPSSRETVSSPLFPQVVHRDGVARGRAATALGGADARTVRGRGIARR